VRFLVFAIVLLGSFPATAAQLSRRQFLAENFSANKGQVKVAFFDADSTLRVSLSGNVSANAPTDVLILPFVAPKIAELNREGYLVMVVSNQGGVAEGHVTMEIADGALRYMADLIRDENQEASIHYFDFAEANDNYRKPKTGMAELLETKLAERDLRVDWQNSFMVGDSAYKKPDRRPDGKVGNHFSRSDRLFAENLKIPFYEPTDFFGWRCHGIDVFTDAEQVRKYRQKHRKPCSPSPN
jgi:bifunctional polynucleotide phosphatase/kinase